MTITYYTEITCVSTYVTNYAFYKPASTCKLGQPFQAYQNSTFAIP